MCRACDSEKVSSKSAAPMSAAIWQLEFHVKIRS